MKTSPFGWIAGSGFSMLRPSSSVIVSRAFAAARSIAAWPGSTTAVGVMWRSLPRVTVPKRPYSKNSRIDSDCGRVTRMPSSGS